MSETIWAACIQATSGVAAIMAAWIALRSWRHQILGDRQVALAEECLQLVWKLDGDIKAARRALFPGDWNHLKTDSDARHRYEQNRKVAFERIGICSQILKDLEQKFTLFQFYIGKMPRVFFKGETRNFKIRYSIIEEYDEIISQLRAFLYFDLGTNNLINYEENSEIISKFEKNGNLFFGFVYEYEEDEYSTRLRITKQSFERHIRDILRRRSLSERLSDRLSDLIGDRYQNKFKPVTINKHPFHSMSDNISADPEATKPDPSSDISKDVTTQ